MKHNGFVFSGQFCVNEVVNFIEDKYLKQIVKNVFILLCIPDEEVIN